MDDKVFAQNADEIVVEHVKIPGVVFVTIDSVPVHKLTFDKHVKIHIVFDNHALKELENDGSFKLDKNYYSNEKTSLEPLTEDVIEIRVDEDIIEESDSGEKIDSCVNDNVSHDDDYVNSEYSPPKRRKKRAKKAKVESIQPISSYSPKIESLSPGNDYHPESGSDDDNQNKDHELSCKYCSKNFSNFKELDAHHRLEGPRLPCGKCRRVFHNQAFWMVHRWVFHGIKTKSNDLNAGTTWNHTGKTSIDVSPNNETSEKKTFRYRCSECGVGKNDLGHLKNHMLTHTGEKLFSCCVCTHQCWNLAAFKNHLARHIRKSGRFGCKSCNVLFDTRAELSRHQMTHSLKCKLCGRTFPNKTSRYFHYQTVHKDDNDILKCSTCGKLFSWEKAYAAHLKEHDSRRKTQCMVCGILVKKASLKKHMRRHADNSDGSNVYVCDQCPKQFITKTALDSHMRTHADSEERPYLCPDCPKRYSTTGGLRNHMFGHQTVKPYVCHICGKACKEARTLETHMKVHEKANKKICEKVNEKYPLPVCSHCGLGFNSKIALDEHMHIVHSTISHPSITGPDMNDPRQFEFYSHAVPLPYQTYNS